MSFAALAIGGGSTTTGSVSALDAPSDVAGDPHSPRVVRLAALALDAREVYERSDSSADEQEYLEALSVAARATAGELGVSQSRMEAAWLETDEVHQTALLTALSQLGAPYRSISSDPEEGFDCSGLMLYAWGAAGFELSRSSGAQISDADARDLDTAMAGDLAQYPGHVMMYLGVPQTFVHASNPQNDVELWTTSEDRAARLRYGDPTE
ncbi:MAG: C40 family peptidase [Acidimicrobiales bacterium]